LYDNCPDKCENEPNGKKWNFDRLKYCDDCKHTDARERFESDTNAVFQERFDNQTEPGEINRLLNLVYQIAGLEESPRDRLPVETEVLLGAYLSEKYKYERYLEARKPKK
jgi:hypothetical protein